MAGIYLHIPFCKQACHYCDFHFSTNQELRPKLVEALLSELHLQRDYLQQEAISTIYFGGGTPSLLPASDFEKMINTIGLYYKVDPKAEITVEANPDDLSKQKLKELYSLGINRLSIGIQSFDDDQLRFFNRAHSAAEAIQSVHHARKAGFSNISIDLIYGVSGESSGQWEANIDKALSLEPEHISSYSLTIEEKTAFGKWAKAGKMKAVEEELAAADFIILMEKMERAGYDHYEISNFCKPGYPSKHNSSYWRQEKYLGIGPSAHSYNGDSRQFNISNNSLYIKSILQSEVPFEIEILTLENRINEYIFTSLRTTGCHLSYLKTNFNYDLLAEQNQYLNDVSKRGFVTLEKEVLKLTRQGKLLADQITSDLFIVS